MLTKSRPVVTQTPPKVIIGKLEDIAALTRRPTDTFSEFHGRIIERGTLLNGGADVKISSATNPDWRLIRKEEEDYFRKNTVKTAAASTKSGAQATANPLRENISDIIKFWERTHG